MSFILKVSLWLLFLNQILVWCVIARQYKSIKAMQDNYLMFNQALGEWAEKVKAWNR